MIICVVYHRNFDDDLTNYPYLRQAVLKFTRRHVNLDGDIYLMLSYLTDELICTLLRKPLQMYPFSH